ncbi:HAD hydrolase-like protein [Pedobacter sp. L105]|uniref:HAD hydrolase-like protein n=1 Tax=Pedobacter sp. L105 TaxID=1641871 RepID=UPI00131DEA5D|nr:HAD hydrolase-like protein [Pedobacter sp. L105]
MSVKLVVFDLAGTTVKDDHEVSKAFQSALKKHGYEIPLEMIDPIMGYEKNEAITKMLTEHEPDKYKINAALVGNIHEEFITQMILHYQFADGIEALPHVEATMAALHEMGIKIGINTGFSRNIAEAIVTRLQWREKNLIDYLVGSDEVEKGRPYSFMIHKMMEAAGITEPLEVVKVGDTEVDVREGQQAGCRFVIGVTTGSFTRAELEKYQPTHIVDDIAAILDIIKN